MMGAVALFAAGDMVAPMIRHGMRHLKSAAPMLKQMFDLNAPNIYTQTSTLVFMRWKIH